MKSIKIPTIVINLYKKYRFELILVTGLTIIFLGLLFNNFFKNPFYYFSADIAEVYYPWWVFLNRAIRSFELPVLNRYWFFGSLPFAALESSLYYPPYILIQFLFNSNINLDLAYFFHFGIEILHYLLASITFYSLCRFGLKLNKKASIFGGVIYACSGVFIGRFVHTVVILNLSWLPAIYLFLLLISERKKIKYAVGLTISLIMVITSGHPQIIFYIISFSLFTAVYLLLFSTPDRKKILFFLIAGSFVFSALIAAPKLLLTYELSQNIERTTDETTIYNLYNSIHPVYYLTLFVPYLFGKHVVGYWGSDYPWGNWENFIYIGIIPILFLPFSFTRKNKKLLLLILLNLVLVIFLMIGKYNPISAQIDKLIPFSKSTTMISKLTIFFHFFLVLLSAMGIDAISKLYDRKKRIVFFLTYTSIIGTFMLFLNPSLTNILNLPNRNPPSTTALKFIADNIIQSRFIFAASFFVMFFYLLFRKKIIFYLLLLIYAGDIFLSAGNFNPIDVSPGAPSLYFGSNQTIKTLKQDKNIFRVDNLWPRNVNMIAGIETTYGYHTVETKAYRQMMALFNPQNRKLLDLLNIKYFITDKDLSSYGTFTKLDNNLWKNDTVLPRFIFVPEAIMVRDKNEMIQQLTNPDFNPQKTVLIYNTEASLHIDQQNDIKNGKFNANIIPISVNTNNVKLTVETNNDGYLILSLFQYPGWYALIDNKRSELIPADLSLYALAIKKGNHTVEVKYESKPLKYGLFITGLSLFSLISLLTVIHYKKLKK